MNNRLDVCADEDSDIVIGTAVLLLLKQNKDISSQSVLEVIRGPKFIGELGRDRAISILVNSLKSSHITEIFGKKIPH